MSGCDGDQKAARQLRLARHTPPGPGGRRAMTAVAFTVLGCVLLASLGYAFWEYHHAVLHDDWADDPFDTITRWHEEVSEPPMFDTMAALMAPALIAEAERVARGAV